MVVGGQVLGRVVAHRDHPEVLADLVLGLAALDEGLHEAAVEEVARPVADLDLDAVLGVVGVKALAQRLAGPLDGVGVGVERGDRDPAPVGGEVVLLAGQAVDVGHAVAGEVAEHVIERAVLHHHDDDVLDPGQVLIGDAHDAPRVLAAERLRGLEPTAGSVRCWAICLSIQSWLRSRIARASAATTGLRSTVSWLSCSPSPDSDQFVDPVTV
jgi:hypothetical protein